MKVNRFVTKLVIRLFFLILVIALVPPFIMGEQNKLQHIYLAFPHPWQMIFPAIIIIAFLFLLISCAIKKYSEPEMNWLLIVNTIVLLAYGIAIYIRVLHLVA